MPRPASEVWLPQRRCWARARAPGSRHLGKDPSSGLSPRPGAPPRCTGRGQQLGQRLSLGHSARLILPLPPPQLIPSWEQGHELVPRPAPGPCSRGVPAAQGDRPLSEADLSTAVLLPGATAGSFPRLLGRLGGSTGNKGILPGEVLTPPTTRAWGAQPKDGELSAVFYAK
ncbi:cytosolic purine 5'-nucleotidase-like [Platysternon megacephalum]|uniref:Cytosolic purine 5'-nucleotidase-like n=1 Tax=Platysternon megacephalum TaxID=55544 RepID=A0A4D9DMS7_9SAUR|nr:cytosolic purine 5'-nucleotidase-like [Platysternon megacephalum]